MSIANKEEDFDGSSDDYIEASWYDDDDGGEVDASFKDYDITASPNDFNVRTICDFVDAGIIKIPAFQRHFVWDIKRASKLIESILIGLPIPQIFLYEEGRNSFLVVDGQQRLMSIYYFFKGIFPRREKRAEIRRILAELGKVPDEVLSDDKYFCKFNLSLPSKTPDQESRFHRRNYATLGEYKTTFDLRTIRNVVIKQTAPADDGDSAVFEIFNRLNTGGVNLKPQEIRSSLFHSDFMSMLERINLNPHWRRFLRAQEPDLHAKDVEILLRSAAMLFEGPNYREPMGKFLNGFAKKARGMKPDMVSYAEELFGKFFAVAADLPVDAFSVKGTKRFNIAIFEAVFRAACTPALEAQNTEVATLPSSKLALLKRDDEFIKATQEGTGRVAHVATRYDRAKSILWAQP